MEDKVKKKLAADPFARYLGIKLIHIEPGKASAELDFRPEFANFAGLMHGGAVFALADYVFSAAANSRGTLEVAVNISINYLASPAPGEKLLAAGEEVGGSRKLGHYRMEVKTAAGRTCALMHGVTYRKGDPL